MKNLPIELLIIVGALIVILVYTMKRILHKKGYLVYWYRGNHLKDFSNFSKLLSQEEIQSKKIKFQLLFFTLILLILAYISTLVYLFTKS